MTFKNQLPLAIYVLALLGVRCKPAAAAAVPASSSSTQTYHGTPTLRARQVLPEPSSHPLSFVGGSFTRDEALAACGDGNQLADVDALNYAQASQMVGQDSAWIASWNTDSYGGACIAFLQGTTVNIPPEGCAQHLGALCQPCSGSSMNQTDTMTMTSTVTTTLSTSEPTSTSCTESDSSLCDCETTTSSSTGDAQPTATQTDDSASATETAAADTSPATDDSSAGDGPGDATQADGADAGSQDSGA